MCVCVCVCVVWVCVCDRASLMIKTALCSRGLYTAQWQGNGEPGITHNDLYSINICFIINQRPLCSFDYRSFSGYSTDKRSIGSFVRIKCSQRRRFPFSLYVLNVSLWPRVCALHFRKLGGFVNVLTNGFQCNKPHYSHYFVSISKQPLRATREVNKGWKPKERKQRASSFIIKRWSV